MSAPFVAVPVVSSVMSAQARLPAVLQSQARLPNDMAIELGGIDAQLVGEAAVLRLNEGLKVYLHRAPVDLRLSINGLAVALQSSLPAHEIAPC